MEFVHGRTSAIAEVFSIFVPAIKRQKQIPMDSIGPSALQNDSWKKSQNESWMKLEEDSGNKKRQNHGKITLSEDF